VGQDAFPLAWVPGAVRKAGQARHQDHLGRRDVASKVFPARAVGAAWADPVGAHWNANQALCPALARDCQLAAGLDSLQEEAAQVR
jgi:hypothetical protein